jgi:hypothetical protein
VGKMPITVLAGLLFIVAALVTYSLGVWGSFRKRSASKLDLTFLWLGVVFDFSGTLMMAIQSTAAVAQKVAANASAYIVTLGLGDTTLVLENNLKTYLALVAMAAMVVTIVAMAQAAGRKDAEVKAGMSRIILAPWALWVVVFVMGLIEKMPKQG